MILAVVVQLDPLGVVTVTVLPGSAFPDTGVPVVGALMVVVLILVSMVTVTVGDDPEVFPAVSV